METLIHRRQELDQAAQRMVVWSEDKQRAISSDPTIPLKIPEIERIQKKFNVTLRILSAKNSSIPSFRILSMN